MLTPSNLQTVIVSSQGDLRKRGFTLIELLVVISIVSLLVALLLPALARSRDTARIVTCGSNQRQIGIGAANYSIDNDNYIAARVDYGTNNSSAAVGPNSDEPASPFNSIAAGTTDSSLRTRMHLGIHTHGSWAMNGYSDIRLFYCPGESLVQMGTDYVPVASGANTTLAGRLQTLITGNIDGYLSSSGLQTGTGTTRLTFNITGYHMNRMLIGSGTTTDTPAMYRAGGWRMAMLDSAFPMLADYRVWVGSGNSLQVYAAHNSEGFNVLRGDGSVRYLNTLSILTAGRSTNVPTTVRNAFLAAYPGASQPGPDPRTSTSASDPFRIFSTSHIRVYSFWEAVRTAGRG